MNRDESRATRSGLTAEADSINGDQSEESSPLATRSSTTSKVQSGLVGLCTVLLCPAIVFGLFGLESLRKFPSSGHSVNAEAGLPVVPAGVNFGGWLCLEDWFYSGEHGNSVMTLVQSGQGACLPPDLPHLLEPWPSEGFLTQRLNQSQGWEKTADIFLAHRHSYIGESDLQDLQKLGIKYIRVPLTWAAFADALAPVDKGVYGSHNPDEDTVIVPDPFYVTLAAFATVPRNWLKELLHRCADHDLQILWDLHAFPGGAADGTYNGVWPSPPEFWMQNVNIGDRSIALADTGLWVAQALINWVEGLDDKARGAVYGVSLMNEPAHMAASDADQGKAFIKSEQQVLDWLASSADMFRKSKLPSQNKKLFVQVIETAFKDFDETVIPWYNDKFSKSEQQSWAVMDRHWYIAWYDKCQIRTVPGGGAMCDDSLEDIKTLLQGCANSFAEDFAKKFDGQKASSEFSVGTYSEATLACNDREVLKAFLEVEVKTFDSNGIMPFFWTWRMPYGKVFEPGWSLKALAGLETSSAEQCFPLPSTSIV